MYANPVYVHFANDVQESTTEDSTAAMSWLHTPTGATESFVVQGRKCGRREWLRDAGIAFAVILAAISLSVTMSNRSDRSCRGTPQASATQASHAQMAALNRTLSDTTDGLNLALRRINALSTTNKASLTCNIHATGAFIRIALSKRRECVYSTKYGASSEGPQRAVDF